MKKSLIKAIPVIIISALLIFTIIIHYKTALKNAYDEGAFFGYAEGYLKHKYHPESNEYFVYDENLIEYVSTQTNVYIAPDKVYHRDGCVPNGECAMIKDVYTEYAPCALCTPPVVMH